MLIDMFVNRLIISRQLSVSSIHNASRRPSYKDYLSKLLKYQIFRPSKYATAGSNKSNAMADIIKRLFFGTVGRQVKQAKCTYSFYRQYYNNYGGKKLISTIFKRFQPSCPACTFAAAACTFSWEKNGISNLEIQEHIDELTMLESVQQDFKSKLAKDSAYKNIPSEWENILDEPNIKMWRLPFKETGFMQYKVFGRFTDISARQFFTVQTDLEYRKKWDNLVIDLSVVDENKESSEQVLRWVSYFPYPFNAREYVYIRRAKVLQEENVIVLLSRSVEHPKCIATEKFVRVPLYISDMVIKPHTSIDEPGLDYLLTYCDNPQMSFPSRMSSWVVTAGIPDYIEKLHKASIEIGKVQNSPPDTPRCTGRYEMPNFEMNSNNRAIGAY